MSELRQIPNVGAQTEQDLLDMGYPTIASLKGKRAEDLYAEECRLRGCTLDRCQLYLYRAVEYFVNTPHPDLTKCKWWLWKDDFVQPSPCGAVCAECASFPTVCGGCRKIRGKVFWLAYTDKDVCPIYECCRDRKRQEATELRRLSRAALCPLHEGPDPLGCRKRGASATDAGAAGGRRWK